MKIRGVHGCRCTGRGNLAALFEDLERDVHTPNPAASARASLISRATGGETQPHTSRWGATVGNGTACRSMAQVNATGNKTFF